MKSVQVDRLSEGFDGVRVVDADIPEPGPGQVRVRMLMCSVNPSDINFIRGDYLEALSRVIWNRGREEICFHPDRGVAYPALPYSLGNEGVGIVDACGSGWLARRLAGRRVAIAGGPPMGTWQEYTIADAKKVLPVPDVLPDEQAAMYIINPMSAYVMVTEVLKVRKGAWLLQNAAGSALASMVVRLGKLIGFRTINVVRNGAHTRALRSLGADVVVETDSQDLLGEVASATAGRGADYAMDCVGGELAGQMLRALALNGHMVVYGTLADSPIPLPSRDMMMPVTRLSGFYAPNWLIQQHPLKLLGLFRRLGKLAVRGAFDAPVEAIYPIEDVRQALEASQASGRTGKVLLRIGQ